MIQDTQLTQQWVEGLFENEIFIEKLSQFISQKPHNSNVSIDQKMLTQIDSISQEISGMIMTAAQKESQHIFDLVAEQLAKLNAQIMNIKNTVFGGNEKFDLETTYYNKSRLEISSILQHDIQYDYGEVKSSIVEMQQRFNEWFGGNISSEQFSAGEIINESKISQFISKKCTQQSQLTEKKIMKRFDATGLLTQRRFEQVSKTMNNVLQMLNEAPNKKHERGQAQQIDQIKTPSANQPSLMRQSSLQNLKIKSFFNFGHK